MEIITRITALSSKGLHTEKFKTRNIGVNITYREQIKADQDTTELINTPLLYSYTEYR